MKSNNSVYKFIDIDDAHNINNLKNQELLCKYFDSYNDPYEGHFGICAKWPSIHKETEALKSLIREISLENAEENIASKESMSKFMRAYNRNNELAFRFIMETTENFRICSFTRRWNHILMWSHYSKGGRGAVLIFDKDKLIQGEYLREVDAYDDIDCINTPLNWVQYKTMVPLINSIDVVEAFKSKSPQLIEKASTDIVQKCILTKHESWRYEQESRLMLNLRNNRIGKRPVLYKYPEAALVGVLVGNRCADSSYLNLANALHDDVNFYLACQSKSKYKYEIAHEYTAKQIKSGEVIINKKLV